MKSIPTFRLDPVTTKEINFRVLFDPDYSTACVVKISCEECSRFDPLCDTFVLDKMDALSEVSEDRLKRSCLRLRDYCI